MFGSARMSLIGSSQEESTNVLAHAGEFDLVSQDRHLHSHVISVRFGAETKRSFSCVPPTGIMTILFFLVVAVP